ncbi:hypothetical protein BI375_15855 [Vibrio rotiferianus]|uniref:Uncharacterized protein n=1 Tax=Vibrio rotiferianus TaxID=190895 RepID=A0ABX3DBY8_9VIBR|nr:hypothetical protein BI375_15855 [Vibrio rotiferianus]
MLASEHKLFLRKENRSLLLMRKNIIFSISESFFSSKKIKTLFESLARTFYPFNSLLQSKLNIESRIYKFHAKLLIIVMLMPMVKNEMLINILRKNRGESKGRATDLELFG